MMIAVLGAILQAPPPEAPADSLKDHVPMAFGDTPYIVQPHGSDRSGRAVLNCYATADRTLRDCRLISIEPDFRGNGEFALGEAHRIGRSPHWLAPDRRYTFSGWLRLANRPEQ